MSVSDKFSGQCSHYTGIQKLNNLLLLFVCSVKSVAQEQKNEIMNQLQTIRYLMKKRGMDCQPVNMNGEQTVSHCGISDVLMPMEVKPQFEIQLEHAH